LQQKDRLRTPLWALADCKKLMKSHSARMISILWNIRKGKTKVVIANL